MLYLQLGNLDLAVQYLRRAIETNPADSHAHYNLGIAYQSSGLPDDAVTAYIKSIRLNPANANAQVNLGNIYKDAGLPDKAISCYKQALEIDPVTAPTTILALRISRKACLMTRLLPIERLLTWTRSLLPWSLI